MRELAAWGVPWNRVEAGPHEAIIDGGKVTLTESADAHGLITARDFGGTRKWRTCYVADEFYSRKVRQCGSRKGRECRHGFIGLPLAGSHFSRGKQIVAITMIVG